MADLVDGIVRFENVRPVLPVNLGNNVEITMVDLARAVISVTGSSSSLALLPLPEGDPRRRCPVIDRAREILRWRPSTSLEDGLEPTADYFRALVEKTS